MNTDLAQFQALLQGMRLAFLDELPERCDDLEERLLALEKDPEDGETFNALYRAAHSLKGSGGTHGLEIVSRICHQLENLLTDRAAWRSPADFTGHALAHVDLLRRAGRLGRQDSPDYGALEAELDNLRRQLLASRRSVLIAESSPTMTRLHLAALAGEHLQITLLDNGLEALARLIDTPFHLAIVGGRLNGLDGPAVIAALRLSGGGNQDLPVILITGNRQAVPEHLRIERILDRDRDLAGNLQAACRDLLG